MMLYLLFLFSGTALASDYSEAIQGIAKAAQAEIDAKNITGVSIALVEGQRIIHINGFGLADKKQKIPAARDTVYRAGSISKLFTDIATMQLAEQKKLSIDQPVTDLVRDFHIIVPFEDSPPITLRQLMCHRSGMIRECPVGSYFDPTEPGLKNTIRSIASCVLVYPPGTKTKYSNSGVSVVGYAVSKVSGIPFEQYARELLFRPMRMTSSDYKLNRNLKARIAKGYLPVADGKGGFKEIEAPLFELGTLPAGNLFTTAEDLALFMRMLLAEGKAGNAQIIRPETLAEMFTPQLTNETNGFGLGFMVGNSGGRKTVSHTGAVYGFTSSLTVMPSEQLGVVVLCNNDLAIAAVQRISDAAFDSLLAAKGSDGPPAHPPETLQLAQPDLAKFAGEFESESFWASVSPKAPGLVANISGQIVTLRPIENLKFEATGRLLNRSTITFDSELRSFKALGQTFHRVGATPPVPRLWKELIGTYGPDFIPLIISERNGHLYAMTENMYDYRLTPLTQTVFKMPPGLYTDEHVVFHLTEKGKAHTAVLANMPLPRK